MAGLLSTTPPPANTQPPTAPPAAATPPAAPPAGTVLQPGKTANVGSNPPAAEEQWYTKLVPEQFRADPNITKYKSVEEFVNGHVNLVKKLGTRTSEPPADAAAYTWAPPAELNMTTEQVLEAKRIAHNLGLDDARAKQMLDHHYNTVSTVQKQAVTEQEQKREAKTVKQITELRGEWGNQFDTNVKRVQATLDTVPELAAVCDAEGLHNSAPFIKAVLALSAGIVRPGATPPPPSVGTNTGSIQQQIADLKKTEAYTKRSHPDWAATQQKVQALYKQAYG